MRSKWPRAVGAHRQSGRQPPRYVPVAADQEEPRGVAEILERIVRRGHVQLIDNSPWFCWRLCPSVIDTIIPYADTAHITGIYSKYLAPELALVLRLKAVQSR